MEIKRIWAVCWSATDTTRTVVQALADSAAGQLGLSVEPWDVTLPAKREQDIAFCHTDLVFFGVPTYAGRVPNVLLPYLREKLRGGGALAVPVVLFGNRDFDDALMELKLLLEENDFRVTAAAAFVGEHSFSRRLGVGRPNREDLALAADFGRQVAERAATQDALPTLQIPGNVPLRPYYTPRDRQGNPVEIRRVKPKTAASCDHCGLCASLCPMGSIDSEDETRVSGICIKCCACEKHCPKGAKYFDDPNYLYHRLELEERFALPAKPTLLL